MLFDLTEAAVSIRVEEWLFNSALLGREVAGVIYLPEIANLVAPLHLLLTNDGQDLAIMQYEQILRLLYQKKQIHPVLTVGIKAGERLQEYGISGQPDYRGRGAAAHLYRRFIVEELLPAVHQRTRITQFASYAVAGFSLGALSALDIAWHHAAVFSRVGAFSGSFWWRSKNATAENPDRHRIAHRLISESAEKPPLKFWLEAGTQDETSDRNQNGIIDAIDDTTSLIQELYRKGYQKNTDVTYVELVGGKHDIPTWGKMMPSFLVWAYGI